jgi:hypothetical protein
VLKNGLQALSGYNTYLNKEKKFQSRNQCLLRCGRVNIRVDILGDLILGAVVLPNRPTGAVYNFLANNLPYSWNISLFIKDNNHGSYVLGHNLIFSAMLDSI